MGQPAPVDQLYHHQKVFLMMYNPHVRLHGVKDRSAGQSLCRDRHAVINALLIVMDMSEIGISHVNVRDHTTDAVKFGTNTEYSLF